MKIPISATRTELLLGCEDESHDFVAAADASHQHAGEHDAQNLEFKTIAHMKEDSLVLFFKLVWQT